MSRYRRWNELHELLAANGQVQVEDAAQALGVSAATVRRDLDELASQQMLTRIRDGAVAQGVTYDLPLRYKTERHPTEKQRGAAMATGVLEQVTLDIAIVGVDAVDAVAGGTAHHGGRRASTG